jgi:hypothetical protein
MIDLCNRTNVDPWFCMPHKADDDTIRQFARLTKERLDPALRVYVEYSNEVWNSQFAQHHYAAEQGVQAGIAVKEKNSQAAWHYTALRSVQIFKIWEEVFGGHERLVRVLPSQAANPAVSEAVLSFQDAYKHADALAVAPYMGFTVGRGKLSNAEELAELTVDQLLDRFEKQGFADSLARMRQCKAIADKYEVKLLAYEAGQHMVAMTKDTELTGRLTRLMHEANRHPRMGQMYERYFDAWADAGGGVMAHFSSIGGWSKYGSWGLMEHFDSNPADYPKFTAVMNAARKWSQ